MVRDAMHQGQNFISSEVCMLVVFFDVTLEGESMKVRVPLWHSWPIIRWQLTLVLGEYYI